MIDIVDYLSFVVTGRSFLQRNAIRLLGFVPLPDLQDTITTGEVTSPLRCCLNHQINGMNAIGRIRQINGMNAIKAFPVWYSAWFPAYRRGKVSYGSSICKSILAHDLVRLGNRIYLFKCNRRNELRDCKRGLSYVDIYGVYRLCYKI